MAKIKFDPTKETDGEYKLDYDTYVVQNNHVFKRVYKTNADDEYEYRKDMSEDDLMFYGTECIINPSLFELKILEITPLKENAALIHAEDGSEFDFWFYEKNHSAQKDAYRVGEVCTVKLFAQVLSAKAPTGFRDGVYLEGDDAKKWFDWVEDEVEEDAGAVLPISDIASYSKTKDFSETGIYTFNATVNEPSYTKDHSKEKPEGFVIAAMNQYNKKYPRFINAEFVTAPYAFPKYRKRESDYPDAYNEGWALAGTLRFVGVAEPNPKKTAVYEYGKNPATFAEDKGLFDHEVDDDDLFLEEQDGFSLFADDEDGIDTDE